MIDDVISGFRGGTGEGPAASSLADAAVGYVGVPASAVLVVMVSAATAATCRQPPDALRRE
ncbi:hypothetical protein AB0I28_19230 [Phytomonospora sp. NPDC050363]|uniref:hypothetical protein n=1 Tax=Phytomonospora sp. NPDC050363 TaxID=3155642 RepID=UPI0033CEEA3B